MFIYDLVERQGGPSPLFYLSAPYTFSVLLCASLSQELYLHRLHHLDFFASWLWVGFSEWEFLERWEAVTPLLEGWAWGAVTGHWHALARFNFHLEEAPWRGLTQALGGSAQLLLPGAIQLLPQTYEGPWSQSKSPQQRDPLDVLYTQLTGHLLLFQNAF